MVLSLFCLVLNSFYFQMCRKQLIWSGFVSKIFIRWWAPTLLGSCEDSQIWYVYLDHHLYPWTITCMQTLMFFYCLLLYECTCAYWMQVCLHMCYMRYSQNYSSMRFHFRPYENMGKMTWASRILAKLWLLCPKLSLICSQTFFL